MIMINKSDEDMPDTMVIAPSGGKNHGATLISICSKQTV